MFAILTEEDLVLEDEDFKANFDSLLTQIDCWFVGIYFPKSDLIGGMLHGILMSHLRIQDLRLSYLDDLTLLLNGALAINSGFSVYHRTRSPRLDLSLLW